MRIRIGVAVALASAACSTAAPRLASPALGGARLPEAWPDEALPRRPADTAAAPRARHRPRPALALSVPRPAGNAENDEVPLPDGLDLERLPRPHGEPDRAALTDIAALADVHEAADLRRLVGVRFEGDSLAFALAALGRLGLETPPVVSGAELVAWAGRRGALKGPTAVAGPGDLLVFDRAERGEPASRIAVALGRDDRGVTEMIYLADGVVRRGFVDAARPRAVRDATGRAVNTFLRHGRDGPPPGTRYLAGELLAHVIPMRAAMAPERQAWESARAGQWRNR